MHAQGQFEEAVQAVVRQAFDQTGRTINGGPHARGSWQSRRLAPPLPLAGVNPCMPRTPPPPAPRLLLAAAVSGWLLSLFHGTLAYNQAQRTGWAPKQWNAWWKSEHASTLNEVVRRATGERQPASSRAPLE
jgi:hypothetical protein